MTSKEALETISKLHFCGYDYTNKDWYESGQINDDYQEEVESIEKDLEVLEKLKPLVKSILLNNATTSSMPTVADTLIEEWLENDK